MAIDWLAPRLAARLDTSRDEPLTRQLADVLWVAVVEGALETGERLPTARELAIALGISPRSVERAYDELAARGVVAVRAGEGTFVSLKQPDEGELERHQQFAALCRDAYTRARTLGFSADDLIDALSEFRSLERGQPE